MLSEVSISALTHGLSLHPQPHTLTLRFPYHEQDYCNMASNHILSRSSTDLREVEQTFSILVSSRADRLLEAADRMRGSRGEVAEGLVRSASHPLPIRSPETPVCAPQVILDQLNRLAETHQASLAQYLEPRGYETVHRNYTLRTCMPLFLEKV